MATWMPPKTEPGCQVAREDGNSPTHSHTTIGAWARNLWLVSASSVPRRRLNSEQAERSLRSFLILQFLQQRDPGETYSGIITGVTSNGALFVMLDRYLADGMVTPENMPGQQENGSNWNLDRTSGRLFAARSGASIGIGDVVEVQIESIDLASREMNLTIVSYQPTKPPAEGSTSGPRQKRDKRGSKSSRNKGSTGKSKGYKMGRRGRRSN